MSREAIAARLLFSAACFVFLAFLWLMIFGPSFVCTRESKVFHEKTETQFGTTGSGGIDIGSGLTVTSIGQPAHWETVCEEGRWEWK